jgi:hypothetical protein
VEVHRETLERHAVHAAAGVARHHAVGAHKAANARIVVAGIVEQQARAVQLLAGEVAGG